MSRRTIYTIITPLPPSLSRSTVLTALHDHVLMIDLNPMVIARTPCRPPRFSPPEEYHQHWYEIHDKVHYLPGGSIRGKVVYHACLKDLEDGLMTHCYAALGTDIKGWWRICGGEETEVPGYGARFKGDGRKEKAIKGLYVREDIDMRTNFLMTGFVKKNLQRAHQALLQRLIVGVHLVDSLKPPTSSHLRPYGTASAPPGISGGGASRGGNSTRKFESRSPDSSKNSIAHFSIEHDPVPVSPMLARPSMRGVIQRKEAAAVSRDRYQTSFLDGGSSDGDSFSADEDDAQG